MLKRFLKKKALFYFINKGGDMARSALRIPSLNQLLTFGVTMLVFLFIMKFMPENVKQWFRI